MTPRVCSKCKAEMKLWYSHSYGVLCKRELNNTSQNIVRAYHKRFDPPAKIGRPMIEDAFGRQAQNQRYYKRQRRNHVCQQGDPRWAIG